VGGELAGLVAQLASTIAVAAPTVGVERDA
jgi:hypothetical protein